MDGRTHEGCHGMNSTPPALIEPFTAWYCDEPLYHIPAWSENAPLLLSLASLISSVEVRPPSDGFRDHFHHSLAAPSCWTFTHFSLFLGVADLTLPLLVSLLWTSVVHLQQRAGGGQLWPTARETPFLSYHLLNSIWPYDILWYLHGPSSSSINSS